MGFNSNVDRSLCSEHQLLRSIVQDLLDGADSSQQGHNNDGALFRQEEVLGSADGWLYLFVTGAPCLSCVGTMRQFQLLLPGVCFRVSIGLELEHEALAAAAARG